MTMPHATGDAPGQGGMMTLQIQRGKSLYQYRINEYNHRQIERRKNQHNARWKHFQYALTEEGARKMLLSLQKEEDEEENE